MSPLVFLLLLGVAAAAFLKNPCDKDIALTTDGYNTPLINVSTETCQYRFTVPSGYYANVFLYALDPTSSDYVYIFDQFGDDVTIHKDSKQPKSESTFNNWPTDFKIAYETGAGSALQIQIIVKLVPYPEVVVDMGTVELQKNGPSSLIYFDELHEGYSYTFTSPNSVYLQADAIYYQMPKDIMQNVFVYDGDNLVGTLNALQKKNAFIGAKLRIFAVMDVPLTGAVFVTDYSNTRDLENHEVSYLPLDSPQLTTVATLTSFNGVNALTVIGNKDGSTPFDVRQIFVFDLTTTLSALPGGPVADYSKATVLKSNKTPYHFSGNLNTFYASGATNFVYGVTQY